MNLASILQHPIEEIQTPPPRHSSSTSTSPILSPHAGCGVVKPSKSTTKRTQTKAACLGCRQRKSKCDGDRPSCKMCLERGSKCEYSVEEGKTQQQATKEQLRSYKDVLSLLRNSSPKESEAILHILKNMDLNDACRFVLDGPVFVPNP